jgi:hypothetical protein
MKKLSITAIFLGVLAMGLVSRPAVAQVSVSISIGGFYDELAPYGEWVDCSYGECWVPERVSADWQPYSNGEWVYTDYGWTWVSYDPWGENPYHYGTWTWVSRYGWVWVPGTVWAPAWVTWSYSDNYIGWAPLPPTWDFRYSGYSGRPVVLDATRYVFVPTNRFVGTRIDTVRVAPQQTATIFRQTTPITRFAVTGGIVRNTALPIDRIQRATGTQIRTRSVRVNPRPIAGWTRGSTRSVSVVAPAHEVRQAIASRPNRGSREGARSTGNVGGGGRRNRDTEIRTQPRRPVEVAPAPQPAPEYRGRGQGQSQGQGHGRGRSNEQVRQQAPPPVERPPVVQREVRQQPVAAQPVQPNPQSLEKPGRGRGPQKENPGQGKGKAKGKEKGNGRDNG